MSYLTEKERYLIEAWLKDKIPVRVIAERLHRCPATIYNEINRGSVVLIQGSAWKDKKMYCADVSQRKQREAAAHKGVKKK